MAVRGHDHADILEHYYPGVQLVHLDDGGQALRGTGRLTSPFDAR
jgi:hypothetical protein